MQTQTWMVPGPAGMPVSGYAYANQQAPIQQVGFMQMPPPAQVPEQPVAPMSESEAIAKRIVDKVSVWRDELKDSKPITTPTKPTTEPATDTASGAAALEAKQKMEMAQADVDEAEARLAEFQKELDVAKKEALAAERRMERALDDRKEMEEVVDSVKGSILLNASSTEKERIENKMKQVDDEVQKARELAESSATFLVTKSKSGEICKFNVDHARGVLSNRNAEFTLAACRAAAEGNDGWMEALNAHYTDKFTYKCPITGFVGDFFDVDKCERAARGEDPGEVYAPAAPVVPAFSAARPQMYVSQPNIVLNPKVVPQAPPGSVFVR